MLFSEPEIKMSEEEFRLIRDFIYENSGIFFDTSSRFLLERRLHHRLEIHNLKSYRDYYRFLLYDPEREEELNAVLDVLTTNETYFFREKCQLKAFTEEILPEMMERKGRNRKIRIWSAGCSTGEEAYTIAMLVLEKGLIPEWTVEIFANDISHRVLQVARKGIYTESSFRATEEYYKRRFFKPLEGGRYRIKEEVKKLVRFGHLNLLDRDRLWLVGKVDVIFCRNVIIYFDREAKKRVIENLYDRLVDGGYLLLGHSESLIGISTAFMLQPLKNDIVYRKPLPSREIEEKAMAVER